MLHERRGHRAAREPISGRADRHAFACAKRGHRLQRGLPQHAFERTVDDQEVLRRVFRNRLGKQ
jgi:hypothetical protein